MLTVSIDSIIYPNKKINLRFNHQIFAGITLLCGANGSGKSSILKAIATLNR
ncbi:AAA family ATPase [Catenovulum sediminis]|uniref:AAA family ATPase n=1 Tax=Catenovulum sediminis TaxID=1740262 RepID=A0ABV1RNT5_9ALTE